MTKSMYAIVPIDNGTWTVLKEVEGWEDGDPKYDVVARGCVTIEEAMTKVLEEEKKSE